MKRKAIYLLVFIYVCLNTTAYSQDIQNALNETIDLINEHREVIVRISLKENVEQFEYLDSLRIVSQDELGNTKITLYSTLVEVDNEMVMVTAQEFLLEHLQGVKLLENDHLEILLKKYHPLSLELVINNERNAQLLYQAFQYMSNTAKVYREKQRDKNSCTPDK
ncbi:hypothetical protein V6R21_00410 [Limibacter armeniacum]|uniref:hypothetical protein n=1 Tax=Limibacter armeniacum TaxID=466084 RepID=UPI002FE546CC